jgi:hypothetical protein
VEILSFINLVEIFAAFAINFIQAIGRLMLETLVLIIWIQTMMTMMMMTTMEQRASNKMPKLLETARMIKQHHIEDATSMRELAQKVMEDAKTAMRDKVQDEDMTFALVVDFCQNMEMPFFGLPVATRLKQSICLELLTAMQKRSPM